MSQIKKSKRDSPGSHVQSKHVSSSIRERVLNAAFTLFREHGSSSTSMLDIVTRAGVSKRDLYALFNNKHAVLAACISERAQRMRSAHILFAHSCGQSKKRPSKFFAQEFWPQSY
jgi:AcrR family transcriptional regulator